MSRRPDITLAQSALGFQPRVTWQRGLAETLDWFAQTVVPALSSTASLADKAAR